jgi:electron transfer flavoprotein alpha subunit
MTNGGNIKNIWVLLELVDNGEPSKLTLGLLSAARVTAEKVGALVTAILFSDKAFSVKAAQVPDILTQYGVSQVITYQHSLFGRFNAEAWAAALLPDLKKNNPSLFLMADSPAGRQLAPYLAAKLDLLIVTDCVKMDFSNPEQPFFYRSVYGRQLYQEISCPTNKTILVTINSKSLFVIPTTSPGKIESEIIEPKLSAALVKIEHLEFLPADFQTVDIAEAETVIGAGMGAISSDFYPLVAELAALLEGSIGATRPVIDSGKVPRERLIGQTGKTITPNIYLALGVSGATHHTGGIQESKKIVAVNRDPQAPIFKNADAGAAADLKEVLPLLIERIKKAKADGEIL